MNLNQINRTGGVNLDASPASSRSPAGDESPSVFVSHCIDDKEFVFEVCDLLVPYLGANMFRFEKRPSLQESFLPALDKELEQADVILVFVGKRYDDYMKYETMRAATLEKKLVCIVDIGDRKGFAELPGAIQMHLSGRHFILDTFTRRVRPDSIGCAKAILEKLSDDNERHRHHFFRGRSLKWNDEHVRYGLPSTPNIFDYEKDMIHFYLASRCYDLINQSTDEASAQAKRAEFEKSYRASLKEWPEEKVRETLEKGIAARWPSVSRYEHDQTNPLKNVKFRAEENEESHLRVNALLGLDAPGEPFTFLEAGPRPQVALPWPGRLRLNVAIVVTGGIAPGINAVIDAIVQRHSAYSKAANYAYNLQVFGLNNGLLAIGPHASLLSGHVRELYPKDTIEHATHGGSILGTSRDDGLLLGSPHERLSRLNEIVTDLKRLGTDILYIIGGDGSMKAAHVLWHKVNSDPAKPAHPWPMSVVAIPKTMDNDILWVWQSFGFLSAVQEAREIIERLHTEVRSNPRLGIVQFFGSGSGFVVSHAVLAAATGHVTLALIPEMEFSVLGVARYIKERLWESADPHNRELETPAAPINRSIPHGLIVMAETAIPLDALQCLGLTAEIPKELEGFYRKATQKMREIGSPSETETRAIKDFFANGCRVQGQTADELRSLGMKLLNELLPVLLQDDQLSKYIRKPGCDEPDWKKLRTVRNEPRYLVRALEPSTSDIINGQRLGILAVDAAMAGFTDCMVSQWLTEFSIVPLELVVLGRKRIPPTGMFWTSVTEKTRQPDDLVSPFPRPK